MHHPGHPSVKDLRPHLWRVPLVAAFPRWPISKNSSGQENRKGKKIGKKGKEKELMDSSVSVVIVGVLGKGGGWRQKRV